ncbi:MAG: hypothetical protein KatS3mg057_2350 [Herpetosiphonaceae bacterium]|nr:MAG: hypothetical protein KatS3mg057_2350 [Herpetosiphonaceae bacterium]
MAALSATIVGSLIVALIGLIDGAMALMCEIFGWDKDEQASTWVCNGITGILTEVITCSAPLPGVSLCSILDGRAEPPRPAR